MRFLVADDDRAIRKLISSTLQKIPGAEVVEASDGDEVFGRLVESRFDALLVDLDMPGRTGLDIIRVLRHSRSTIPIMMVSATSDKAKIIEAIQAGVSDYLVKPFETAMLSSKIRRICSLADDQGHRPAPASEAPDTRSVRTPAPRSGILRQLSEDDRPLLTEVLRQIDNVATIPELAAKVLEATNKPEASVAEISGMLSQDPVMTARLLRLVNSAAFGLSQRISKVQQAVSYLGLKQVRDLVVTISVSDVFRGKGTLGNYSRIGLWRHMVAVGICSRLIARQTKLAQAEDAFLAGLLHDIGIIMEDQYAHQPFCTLLRSLAPEKPFTEQERQHLAFDHTTLGGRIAEKWRFPQTVLNAIRYHHASASYQEDDRLLVRCVELANGLCTSWGHWSVGPNVVKAVSPGDLGLPLEPDALEAIASRFERELGNSSQLLEA